MTREPKERSLKLKKRGFIKSPRYAITWVKQYWFNRAALIVFAWLFSIGIIGYFNVAMSGNVNTPIKVLEKLNLVDYEYVGITNHSNYLGDNFYQQIDEGFFFTSKKNDSEFSGVVNALTVKRLKGKTYTDSTSPIENCKLLEGNEPCNPYEVLISENIAKRSNLNIGNKLYYDYDYGTVEFTVSGIIEEFYGAYDIKLEGMAGLIILSEDSTLESESFIRFFSSSNNETYSKIYLKSEDVKKFDKFVRDEISLSFRVSVLFLVLIFVVFNIGARKYFKRLRNEDCTVGCMFVFLIGLIVPFVSLVILPIVLSVFVLGFLREEIAFVLATEYFSTIIILTVVYLPTLIQNRRRRRIRNG
jgi:hypothetical protein